MKQEHLIAKYESLNKIIKGEPSAWINPLYLPFASINAVSELVVDDMMIQEAAERLGRFAPFLMNAFPETELSGGIIESPLVTAESMQAELSKIYDGKIPGHLYLKLDSQLAVAGSVKARGGIYEVLQYAEKLALANGIISADESYAKFASEDMHKFFSQYTIQAGSTGNLGLSIGIISAALGFRTIIHMSADAKEWKKALLRKNGVEVVEYENDYLGAVAAGRESSAINPRSYFIDDEQSINLFLGYAVAGQRLAYQLEEKNIIVSPQSPLLVYLPAGVGGAPGGIAYGLKRIFKDNVHCFFVEPTQCPSVLLGIATQLFEKADVRHFGLSGRTAADGLACARPSVFATRLLTNLLSGVFTVNDADLFEYLRLLYKSEGRQVEPSACAGFGGAVNLLRLPESRDYCRKHGLTAEILENCTQIVWTTGGALVSKEVRADYLQTYLRKD